MRLHREWRATFRVFARRRLARPYKRGSFTSSGKIFYATKLWIRSGESLRLRSPLRSSSFLPILSPAPSAPSSPALLCFPVRFTSQPASRLVVLLLVWRLHRALWHAISFIRNIMPCWTSLALAGRPIHAQRLVGDHPGCSEPADGRIHMYHIRTYVRAPEDYIETVVNFNFVHPRARGESKKQKRFATAQRVCMSKDGADPPSDEELCRLPSRPAKQSKRNSLLSVLPGEVHCGTGNLKLPGLNGDRCLRM